MRKFARRNRPIVIPPEVALDAGLPLADIGLYVKLEHLLEHGDREADIDHVIHELLDGAAGPVPGVTADSLREGIERLAAAGLYDL